MVRPIAYQLKLLEIAQIHTVFHISQLKKHLGLVVISQPLPKGLSEKLELKVYPKVVLNYRYSSQGELEIFIKWDRLPNCECFWEWYESIKCLFLQLHLEGKVPLNGRGNVRSQVCTRRRAEREAVSTGGRILEPAIGTQVANTATANMQPTPGTIGISLAEVAPQGWRNGCGRRKRDIVLRGEKW